ncbi:MAG: SpoIID/LytB domain-containing protein [Actinomycetota bacterium]
MRSTPVSFRYSLVATVVVALLTLALVAPPASAQKMVRINGRGWGHGIGMSQYGAFGYAQHGWRGERILRHYYTGAKVVRRNVRAKVRVSMLQGRSSITIRPRAKAKDGGRVVLRVKGSTTNIVTARPGAALRLEAASTGGARIFKNGNRVRRNGRTVFGSTKRPIVAHYAPYGTQVDTDGKGYAVAYGKLEFVSYSSSGCSVGKCLSQVAVLGMQPYLYGLGEVPSSWPRQTLRSQAMAGRTYAFAKMRTSRNRGVPCFCTVYDSVSDQVFVGEAKRTGSGTYWKNWKKAVDSTNKKVILAGGKPITALYSSSSGGHTEANSIVWGSPQVSYLRGVKDPYDRAGGANPNFRWSLTMSWAALRTKLTNSFGSFGKLKKLVIVRTGVSGRVAVNGLKIVGSKRTLRVSGWNTRNALGLKDSWFRFKVFQTAVARTASISDSLASDDEAEPVKSPESTDPPVTPAPTEIPTPEPSPLPTESPSP